MIQLDALARTIVDLLRLRAVRAAVVLLRRQHALLEQIEQFVGAEGHMGGMAEGVISTGTVAAADDPNVLAELGPAHRADVDDVYRTGGMSSAHPMAGTTAVGTGTAHGTRRIVGTSTAGSIVGFVGDATADHALVGQTAGVLGVVGQTPYCLLAAGRCRPARFVVLFSALDDFGEAIFEDGGDLFDDGFQLVVLDGIVGFGGAR